MSNDPTPAERREIHWCVIACAVSGHLFTMRLPESLIDLAVSKGWRVLIRDSEMPTGPHDIEPAQRNENRAGDTGDE